MQTTFIFRHFLFIFCLAAQSFLQLACAKPGLSQNLMASRSQLRGPSAENSQPEPTLEYDSGISFGAIELAGQGCNIYAGRTATVGRDTIHLPDFSLSVAFLKSGLTQRASCNLSIPLETRNNVGFVINGLEVIHEHFLPKATQLRISVEAFLPGQKGPTFEEILEGRDTSALRSQKLLLLPEPLLVCGKASGLLRINANQVLERTKEKVSALSDFTSLKILFVPIDCAK